MGAVGSKYHLYIILINKKSSTIFFSPKRLFLTVYGMKIELSPEEKITTVHSKLQTRIRGVIHLRDTLYGRRRLRTIFIMAARLVVAR